MKLKIVEYFWAVGRRTKRRGSHKIPLVAGQTLGVDDMQFKIEKAGQESVTVSYCRKDGTVVKTFTFDRRVGYHYRPTSFDGGREYRFKVTRFF